MALDLTWLPDRHLPVAATLAHADDLIGEVSRVAEAYADHPDGVLELTGVVRGRTEHTTVVSTRPVPRSLALFTADALTTLRAAIEHTLYAEVEHLTGRALTDPKSRAVEMPAHTTAELFDKWVKDRSKRAAPPMYAGTELIARVRTLQPYHLRKTPDLHPLKVLAEHTNLAKHRMPALAATRVAHVHSQIAVEGLVTAPEGKEPLRAGDVLASTPVGVRVPLTIFPTIGLRRPHTGEWPVAMHELGWLADWTRKVAIPIIITGSKDVPPLPANFDLNADDERQAISNGTDQTALNAMDRRIKIRLARENLPEILAVHPSKPPRAMLEAWIGGPSDTEVLERIDRLQPVISPADAQRSLTVTSAMITEAVNASKERQSR